MRSTAGIFNDMRENPTLGATKSATIYRVLRDSQWCSLPGPLLGAISFCTLYFPHCHHINVVSAGHPHLPRCHHIHVVPPPGTAFLNTPVEDDVVELALYQQAPCLMEAMMVGEADQNSGDGEGAGEGGAGSGGGSARNKPAPRVLGRGDSYKVPLPCECQFGERITAMSYDGAHDHDSLMDARGATCRFKLLETPYEEILRSTLQLALGASAPGAKAGKAGRDPEGGGVSGGGEGSRRPESVFLVECRKVAAAAFKLMLVLLAVSIVSNVVWVRARARARVCVCSLLPVLFSR